MLSIEQIAQNLNVSTDSALAQEFYKKQLLTEKGFHQLGNYFLKAEDAKELESIGPIDNDLMIPGIDEAQIEANQKKHKEIRSRRLTLDEAFELAQSLPSVNKMWNGAIVSTKSFINGKGENRIQIFIGAKRYFSYTEGTVLETVIEDAIFELHDSVNRQSAFHKKENIENLIKLVY